MTGPDTASRCSRRAHGVDWTRARVLAAALGPMTAAQVPLRDAVDGVLAEPATAAAPIPHYDSSAMDGWAVAGAPPWRMVTAGGLASGEARVIVTGGVVPGGADAVVAIEDGRVHGEVLQGPRPDAGAHVRRAGEEAAAGALLVPAGTRLTPAHVAVLAIAGVDEVLVRLPPRVAIVLTGDEVVTAGRPAAGRVRDAFDPLLPLAVQRLGGRALDARRVGDDPTAIRAAIDASGDADVVVTVGGTGRSGADRLREALDGAATVFDGVAMRPGHPALLARLPDGRPLLGLPGNPLAAVAVLLSFLPPLLDGLTGRDAPPLGRAPVAEALPGWPGGVALIPCAATQEGLRPARSTRPNMLRGLAASVVLAVVPPEGVRSGAEAEVLPLPW